MKWAKTTRFQTSIKINFRAYNILCESDFDDGYAIYINKEYIADSEELPTREELERIISENIKLENEIKNGYAMSGVFENERY